jgi:hypothetical protein
VPCRRLRSQTFGLSIDTLLTATRIECHLRLRAPVVQPSFVRLAARLAPSQAPLHALRNTIQTGVLPSCARSGSPLVPRSPPGPVTPRQPHHTAPDNRRGTLRARCAVCSAVRTSFPDPPTVGTENAVLTPPQPSHHALRQIQAGARCSIRPVRGAYRADLAPVGFNTAPSQRAGNRRSNRYAAFGPSIVFSMTIPLRSALSWNLL